MITVSHTYSCHTHTAGEPHTSPQSAERDIGKLDCNLGVLLIDYFRFYGRALNYYDVGVTCAKGGFCYNKRATVKQDPRDRGDRLSLLDPLDDTNDVSRCAHP